jgi:uncharacterized protein (TIGR00299 family) protein
MLAYFDCFSGISGDMTLGALMDLGVTPDWLETELKNALPLEGFHLRMTREPRQGISACAVTVSVTDHATSRTFGDIRRLVETSRLSDTVKVKALAVFERLAAAEAAIHGSTRDAVHFHEVGGLDALVDVIGSLLALEQLGIGDVIASPIALGRGFAVGAHGKLPVPAPATLAILKGVPVYGTDIAHELTTPTGAALVATLARAFEPLPQLVVERIGYGAGGRDLPNHPNLLRIITGRAASPPDEQITVVETCIDDMNPEIFGFIMERLFADGALDVYWVPVFMKKNRPGTLVQVLCRTGDREAIMKRLLTESTTAGLRYRNVYRKTLERARVQLTTVFGEVTAKSIRAPDGTVRVVPEYEVCRRIAREQNVPIREVYDIITQAGRRAALPTDDD